jgi:trehalose 6-phosphate phosphatase
MTHRHWDAALDRLAQAHRPLVALDFDGTLAPLQTNPDDSRIEPTARDAIFRLSEAPELTIALVSGRGLADLAKRAEVPDGTELVGSHGAEWGVLAPGGKLAIQAFSLTSDQFVRLERLQRDFKALTRDGAWVEIKPAAAVFHTRPMPNRTLAASLRSEALALAHAQGAEVTDGKEALEASVVRVSKAEAIARLRREHEAGVVLFAGDDATDESAFNAMGRDDIGIKIGPGPTAASLRMATPAELGQFLNLLADRITP